MKEFHIVLLFLYFRLINTFKYDDILSLFRRSNTNLKSSNSAEGGNLAPKMSYETQGNGNQNTARVLSELQDGEMKKNSTPFHHKGRGFRRSEKLFDSHSSHDDSYRDSSTSAELAQWREDFQKDLKKRKADVLESLLNGTGGRPLRNTLNMAVARPWGIPCGDPNVHDQPWGTCLLPMQCEAEYRIYGGDRSCKYTQFICCLVQETQHDMSEDFDTVDETSGSSDTEEKRRERLGSKEMRRRKRARRKYRRIKERQISKTKIKKLIRNIGRQIDKILVSTYRGYQKVKPMREIMVHKYIKDLKRQFKMDRKIILNLHQRDVNKMIHQVRNKFGNIKKIDFNEVMNGTFKELLNRASLTKDGLRMLNDSYPELAEYLMEDPHFADGLSKEVVLGSTPKEVRPVPVIPPIGTPKEILINKAKQVEHMPENGRDTTFLRMVTKLSKDLEASKDTSNIVKAWAALPNRRSGDADIPQKDHKRTDDELIYDIEYEADV
ncbi:uncharacterized protein LOC142981194 [Anticarsia gemmatalis]|uniref:uncharacterized protein LOC142981194 n=1 Tax=Anticarsia gemmatalis TaxID=129554 RepID=UPI003F767644